MYNRAQNQAVENQGCCTSRPAPVLWVYGETIEVVDSFCYLGSMISSRSIAPNEDIAYRIGKASTTFQRLSLRLWKRHDIAIRTKNEDLQRLDRPYPALWIRNVPLNANLAVHSARDLSHLSHPRKTTYGAAWWARSSTQIVKDTAPNRADQWRRAVRSSRGIQWLSATTRFRIKFK